MMEFSASLAEMLPQVFDGTPRGNELIYSREGGHGVCFRAECSRGRRRWLRTSRNEPNLRGKCAGAMELLARSARSLRRVWMLRALRTASILPRKKGMNLRRAMRQPPWVIRSAAWGRMAAARWRAGRFDQKTISALRAIRRWSAG